jgi:hypothetical protein
LSNDVFHFFVIYIVVYPCADEQTGNALWEGANEVSESDLSSSEIASEGEEPFIGGDVDFANAVARAAQMAGMTVVGSTVTDPARNESGSRGEKVLQSQQ